MEEKKKTVFADLGQKGYREVWELQERLLEKVKAEKAGNKIPENHLLFVEHDPVYTLGKSGNEANMLISAIQLRAKHAEFIKVDRGGLCRPAGRGCDPHDRLFRYSGLPFGGSNRSMARTGYPPGP